jgi:hypothetical protein
MTSYAITYSARLVFRNGSYLAVAVAIATAFWIIFNILDGLLFFSPIVTFYYPLPGDSVPGFILSNITASMIGVVVGMNAYIFRNYPVRLGKSFISGSALGTVSSMCASCSSVGFFLSTSLGSAGVAATTILTNYQIPLRLVAIGLLIWAYYSAHRKIVKSCMVNQ